MYDGYAYPFGGCGFVMRDELRSIAHRLDLKRRFERFFCRLQRC
jgi:hypothetical protein